VNQPEIIYFEDPEGNVLEIVPEGNLEVKAFQAVV
jgi:catechol-2,3-dioxygenase